MNKVVIKFENWPRWFASIWPTANRRWLVLQGYRALGTTFKDTLADIALRNNVFASNNAPSDRDGWIAEGRRQCALEIFKLAQIDHATLFERTKVDRTTGENR
ncbi:hypothetical protein VRZ08_05530 [Rhodopseudomonas sp. G2_2311]|uniref:hypothetical protein n=1 Tax=Rhodopseudomonas sp. G2_2311 TaxID=3114287 RepID=UPI0039C6C284